LQAIADRTLETRKKETDTCDSLIKKHVCDFEGWLNRTSERASALMASRAVSIAPKWHRMRQDQIALL
jgi:hypothetical protein